MHPQAQSIQCPQCGAPAPFRGHTVTLVCEYCGSTVVRTAVDLRLVGRVSALVDNGSPILLDGRGRFRNLPFSVVGRLQVQYGRGTWNEWFLEFADGTVGWLADAQGSFAILRPRPQSVVAGRVPPYSAIALNQIHRIDGVEMVVVDRRGAAYKGSEGSLPLLAEPGLVYHSVDLRGFSGEFATLDYGNQPEHVAPMPYLGEAVDLAEIGLHPLRQFQGWRFTGPGAGAQPARG